MKPPFHRLSAIVLILLASVALPASFPAYAGARPDKPAVRAEKTQTLTDLPADASAAIVGALEREGVLAPDELMAAQLTASNGENGDAAGSSVAISGDTVVVGAPFHKVGSNANQGSAYVFVKPAGGWSDKVESAKLTASDGASGDFFGGDGMGFLSFGGRVAISGDTVVVGAQGDDIGSKVDQGSAYVFVKPTGGWVGSITESAKLTASDGAASDVFGTVAIAGDTVVVGAYGDDVGSEVDRGSAYVFLKPAGGWAGSLTEKAKLTASDGAASDFLGRAVTIADDTVVVGASADDIGSRTDQGSAYVFIKPAGGWNGPRSDSAKLIVSNGLSGDGLGGSVAITGGTVVVGAPLAFVEERYQGSAYVFLKPTGGWTGTLTESATLTASDGGVGEFFGNSVAVESDTIVVGAPSFEDGLNTLGSVYLFVKPAGGWAGSLTESEGLSGFQNEGRFGSSVAIAGGTVVAGGPDDYFFNTPGAAYVFEGPPPMNRALMADVGSPTFTPEADFADNTIELESTVPEGVLRVMGDATITPDSSNQTQITVTGSYSALAGDVFSTAYSFTVDLNTGNSATYTVAGTVSVNGVPVEFSDGGVLLPGLHKYEGAAQTIPFPTDASGDFSATLTFDFGSNGAALTAEPGTLDLAIQQLDFQLDPLVATVVTPSQSQNISTRANVGTGDNVLIGGFIVDGTDPKMVVLRAIGPSLAAFGVTGVLADPLLELHDITGATLATNDNWMELSADDQTILSDNNLAPADDLESALVMTLDPGAYTAIVRGTSETTGVALVEAYDIDGGTTDSRLANISTRGFVATGDSVMIGGFIVGGGGGFSSVIVRGIGPSLSSVPDALADPTLEVHNGNGDLIDSNDNWMSDPNMQAVIDHGLSPSDPNESALLEILPPGPYTAILAGAGGSAGVGLVETYDVD